MCDRFNELFQIAAFDLYVVFLRKSRFFCDAREIDRQIGFTFFDPEARAVFQFDKQIIIGRCFAFEDAYGRLVEQRDKPPDLFLSQLDGFARVGRGEPLFDRLNIRNVQLRRIFAVFECVLRERAGGTGTEQNGEKQKKNNDDRFFRDVSPLK